MPTYQGSCHCGAVRFEIEAELTEFVKCDCSICRKRNAVMASVHESDLRILAGENKLTLYRWNTGIAKHYFCGTCGIYPFHKRRTMPEHYSVNVYCLEDAPVDDVPVVAVEGRSLSRVDYE